MDLTLKYRPKEWEDVVGQEFITNILRKQVETHTFRNTYLFCGAYGSGKTTCARILADKINNGNGSPIEIDGASNNGVDNIRALIDDAQTAAVGCDYKVFIIDEAHMITVQAWNAALKLIEEPPSHCVFIFCTTNAEKIPSTILSRVQRFDFGKIPNDKIVNRLIDIIKHEGIDTYDIKALNRIASLSDGHMRDAVKALDGCLNIDHHITQELVESLYGLISQESVEKIVRSLLAKDISSCISEYEHCLSRSFDGVKLYDALLGKVLDAILYQMTKHNGVNPSLKNMGDIFYANRKYVNRDSADSILRYCFIGCCQ